MSSAPCQARPLPATPMRKLFGELLITVILFSSMFFFPPAAGALGPTDVCRVDGGSSGLAGQNCTTYGEWRQVTFSVTALCRNTCTGGTWTASSDSVSMQSTLSCQSCPLKQKCTDCIRTVSDQRVEFYTEVERRKQSLFTGCAAVSSMKATATCSCPGCGGPTPILISLNDGEYELTSAADGVRFDLDGDGQVERTAWTAAGSDEGFLALDRNFNGKIDDYSEVFGNHTPQLPSDDPNGWKALAVWDDAFGGGNEDGIIDGHDSIFGDLLIWVDRNHNGVSESNELKSLEDEGILYLDLDYDAEQGRVDDFGNGFRFPSTVGKIDGSSVIAWDVFFALPVANRR